MSDGPLRDLTALEAPADRPSVPTPAPTPAARMAEESGVTLPGGLLTRAPAMYHADDNGRIVFTNPGFEAILQAGYPGALGPGGVRTPPQLEGVFERLRQQPGEDVVIRHSFAFGAETRYFRSTHFRLSEDGQYTGFAGIYTDVTLEAEAMLRSARSEARFQDLIRSSSDWAWETDANLNITYVSNRISEALEVAPAALHGKPLFGLGRFEDEKPGSMLRTGLTATLTPFRGRIFLMEDSRGRQRRIALSGVPVFDDATGKFTGYRGTGTDITLQHEAEERAGRTQVQLEASLEELRQRNVQLDQALNEARAAALAKTEFLGKMSHELRTPLNAIIGFAEMSVQQVFGPLNDRYLNYFRDIRSAAHHLLHIINDILDAVNIEANKVSIAARPVRLATIVDEARSIGAVRAEQQGVDFSQVTADDHWTVMADPARVRQILVNLLTNAVKFTERGGRVGIDVHQAGADALDITVWDTGIGIPKAEQDKIFESFHQIGSDVLTAPREGTGLGLTISRQLARLMGGDITVESTPGAGSRFTVRLPVATAPDQERDSSL